MNTFFEEVVEQESAQIALETEIYENMHETFSRMTQGEAEKFLENHIYYLVTRHRYASDSYGVSIAMLFVFCSNAIQAAAKAIQTVHPQINTVAIVGKTKYKFTQDCVRKYFPEKHAWEQK